ncbi:nucleotidyl transferase AbiEii/AbiGii toxin family protein [bacterium]
MKESQFYKKAELALRMLPIVYTDQSLALKGGSAINYYVRDFPRLSVDLDLTYVPVIDRTSSLQNITQSLIKISERAQKDIQDISIIPKRLSDGTISTLLVKEESTQIKVEVNLVIRGTIHPCNDMNMCPLGVAMLEQAPKARVLSFPDLYGGKIYAALDRQHPRDLFDIKLLLENESLTEEVRKAFIVYLISHSRSMVELLDPHFKDLRPVFENEFQGMTREPVTLQDLINVRKNLIQRIHHDLTNNERRFILSVKDRHPDWSLLGIQNVENLPAVQWKLKNLNRMNDKRHNDAVEKLKQCLKL